MYENDYVYLDLSRFCNHKILNYQDFLKFRRENNLKDILKIKEFTLISSTKEKIPQKRNIDKEETSLKYLLSMYGLDIFGKSEKELPKYLFNKIKYARRNNDIENLHCTMLEISDELHFRDYINLFQCNEIYDDINSFFDNVYQTIIDQKIEVNPHSTINDIIINFLLNDDIDLKFKTRDVLNTMQNMIHRLSKNNEIRDQLNYIINKYGIPYIAYDDIKKSKDLLICGLDYFMIIGILVAILIKLNYEIIDVSIEVIRMFGLNDIIYSNVKNTNEVKEKIITIINSFLDTVYIDLIINTTAHQFPIKLELEFETKEVVSYNNLADFYYKFFISNIETAKFKKKIRKDEAKEIRLWLKKDYERLMKVNPEKEKYYDNLIKGLNKKDDNTIRRQYRSRKIIQN